jgi:enoyl-[acyl-carrier protein] reductase III
LADSECAGEILPLKVENLQMESQIGKGRWALVLGASSGFGEACVRALAGAGYGIFGVHLDRRAGLQHVAEVKADLDAQGTEAHFYNMNAADPDKMESALDDMASHIGEGQDIGVLMHSLAFGTLREYTGENAVTPAQMDMTLRVMAHSLVDWTRGVVDRGLMGEHGRIFAMTSSGSARVIPSYGPVSAAKSALEAHCRQLAYELAPQKITVNALRGGVTDTPALRKIPGNNILIDGAAAKNPSGRLTTPEDVAAACVALCDPRTHWLTGNVINVDGGEEITV